jgi:hypothetical protein
MLSPNNSSMSSFDEKPSPIIPSSPNLQSLPDSKDTPATTPLENFQPAFKPGRGFLLAFFSICIITLAAALDATSLSIALPIITEKLRGTAIEAFWSGTSFLVTSAVFQPVIAGLSHVFGRKQVCHTQCLGVFERLKADTSIACPFVLLVLCCGLDCRCRGYQLHNDVRHPLCT